MSNVGIKGEYQAIVLDAQGNVKENTGWFDNLLLDNFFTTITTGISNKFAPTASNKTLRVGTGTTAPNVSQTALINQVASTTTKTTVVSAVFLDGQGRTCQTWEDTFTFPLGGVVATISEVGWQMNTGGTTVHSRALISDVNGNPTSITLTAQDQLVVKYKLTLVDIYKEASGTITLNGQNYNWVSRRSQGNSESGGGWFSGLLGGSAFASANISLYYGNSSLGAHGVAPIAGNQGADINLTAMQMAIGTTGQFIWQVRLPINQGNNANGIKVIAGIGTWFSNKFEFTPAIPKTNQQTLNIDFAHTVSRL